MQNRSKDPLSNKVQELERLVETISRSKMMWERTFDVISDPVLIINRNYDIKRANKAMAKACNLDIRKVISQKCYKVFAGYDAPCPKCPVTQTLSGQESCSVELGMFPRHRQYFVNAYGLPDVAEVDDESIVLYYRDITDEKQLQKKLTHSEKMAAVGTLAGGVAHEINNPLGGILAFVQLVMREVGEDHSCMEDLKEIEDAALRCKKIVRNLLDFSRQEMDEEMSYVFLHDVIHKTMAVISLNAKTFGVDVKLELDEDLPPMQGDVNKLQQVVLNLITNALHAMKETGGVLTISTFANPEKSKVFLQIRDTGSGINKDDLTRIFDPYFTTKGQGEGTGLGLSICYKIVEEHRGKIDVESEPGRGTAMTLHFPSIQAD